MPSHFSEPYNQPGFLSVVRPAHIFLERQVKEDPQKYKLVLVSLSWHSWYNPFAVFRRVHLTKRELWVYCGARIRAEKQSFGDGRQDKDTVLARIREEWGSEDAFDQYVRQTLPHVLLEGKRLYYQQFGKVMIRTMRILFGKQQVQS